MADFCKQCSEELFGQDYGDLANIADPGDTLICICEGCGECEVDHTGKCISSTCLKQHSPPVLPSKK